MTKYRQLMVRLLTGAWCLSCFVLVTAYSSVLVSFLTAPDNTYSQLVNSANELINKSEIGVTTNKGLIAEITFKVIIITHLSFHWQNIIMYMQEAAGQQETESRIATYLNQKLKEYPGQRCDTTEQCTDQVLKGSSVYINVIHI